MTNYDECLNTGVTLKDEEPTMFEVVLAWIYRGAIPRLDGSHRPTQILTFVKAWSFGLRLSMIAFQNALMDSIRQHHKTVPLHLKLLNYYDGFEPQFHPLQRYILDQAIYDYVTSRGDGRRSQRLTKDVEKGGDRALRLFETVQGPLQRFISDQSIYAYGTSKGSCKVTVQLIEDVGRGGTKALWHFAELRGPPELAGCTRNPAVLKGCHYHIHDSDGPNCSSVAG